MDMHVDEDGRTWRLGTATEVDWLQDRPHGCSIATAMPLVFDAYATFHPPAGVTAAAHEGAVVEHLVASTAEQPWWLAYLDTGAHDVVFSAAPRVSLYWDWRYVLVEAGPQQALTWRTGHMRDASGSLPDLFFPRDRSWLVTALWDDAWTCIGAPVDVIDMLGRDPLVSARRVQPGQDVLPPGFVREGP